MNDTTLRHVIAFVATLITALAWYAGYVSGQYGWWWTIVAVVIVYGIIYKLVDADH